MCGGFTFGGIRFEEYQGKAVARIGENVCAVSSRLAGHTRGTPSPTGTIDTFGTYFAPADFNETVNTLGLSRCTPSRAAQV